MNTYRINPKQLGAVVASLALVWGAATARAAFLFTDGDFSAQTLDQPVGSPWGPVGAGDTVTLDAQSPFGNVYANNGKGVHVPATDGNIYIVRGFSDNAIPPASTDRFYFNVDFRNHSTEAGDYSLVITRDANGSARSVAFYVTGDTLYAESAEGYEAILALQTDTWYNLQVVLDLAAKTYLGTVASRTESTVITSRSFVNADQAINCVYSDGGTSYAPGAAPDHDLDNWAVSTTPLEALGTGPFVKSTSPSGDRVAQNTPIAIELEDQGTQVAPGTIQLFLNAQSVTPTIDKPAGSGITTIQYKPSAPLRPGGYDVRLIFGDNASPSVAQTNQFSFIVPGPTVTSISPVGAGNRADAPLRIEVTDFNTQLATNSVQLILNGQAVTPAIARLAGSATVTTILYSPAGGWTPDSTNTARFIFSDSSTPPVTATNEFSFSVVDITAVAVVNIDFNGARNIPGPDVLGPTYRGVGAGGGGNIFNGLAADSRLSDGTDDDNLTVSGNNLLNSVGDPTAVSFTVSPMGGDVGGTVTTDPASPEALLGDYIFNNSAGNTAGESPFTIGGLGTVPFVDLYFYRSGGIVAIPGAVASAFSGQGIFTPDNTVFFSRLPVTNGTVEGVFGSGTTVVNGLSIVSPLPRPYVKSLTPTGGGVSANATVEIVLEDYTTQVATHSIQLFVNGRSVSPAISKPAGSPVTTIIYAPSPSWPDGSTNRVQLIFADTANPPSVQTNSFSFAVLSQASAAATINIDFNGARNVPGPRGPGPTFAGQGAAGGGAVWNGILANSQLEDGTDEDNLTLTATNLVNSLGAATKVSFTISPVGGDDADAPDGTDPAAKAALFGDYIFVGSAGQITGTADFTLSGLGSAPSVDLYFYYGANGNFTVPGGVLAPYTANGIFTSANTLCYRQAPVANGTVTATFGTGPVSLLYGLTVVLTSPQLGPLSISRQNGNVILSWPGAGTLQSADQITGPWTDETGAASPRTVTTAAAGKFFKLRQ